MAAINSKLLALPGGSILAADSNWAASACSLV
jgi:hypothetical protein